MRLSTIVIWKIEWNERRKKKLRRPLFCLFVQFAHRSSEIIFERTVWMNVNYIISLPLTTIVHRALASVPLKCRKKKKEWISCKVLYIHSLKWFFVIFCFFFIKICYFFPSSIVFLLFILNCWKKKCIDFFGGKIIYK